MRRKLKRFAKIVLALALAAFIGWHSYIEVRLTLAERAVKKLGYPVTLDGWLERWAIPPGEPNAADLYRQAFELMSDEGINVDLLPIEGSTQTPEQGELYPADAMAEMRRYVTLNEDALTLLFRAGMTARCNFRPTRADAHRELVGSPTLRNARRASRLLSIAAILRSEEGNLERAATALESTIAFAGHLDQGNLHWLTGVALLSRASSTLELILDRHEMPPQSLTSLAQAFDRLEKDHAYAETLVAATVESQLFFTWSFLNFLEDTEEQLIDSSLQRFSQRVFMLGIHTLGMPRLMRIYSLRDLPVAIPLLALPPHQSLERISESNWSSASLLSRRLAGSRKYSEKIGHWAVSIARIRSGRTALLIESYRAQVGDLPQSLSDLVPTFADSIPSNPFTGADVLYERTEKGYRIICRQPDLEFSELLGLPKKRKIESSFTVERIKKSAAIS